MIKTKILNIINSLKKIYKLVINKNIINLIFYCCWSFVILGVILMICGLTINHLNQLNKLIISLTGLIVCFCFLLIYYLFEFLRRKTINKITKEINFISIYNNPLLNEKIINSSILDLKDLKNNFSVIHAKYANMISTNINISKIYGIYELLNKNKSIIFSYFLIYELGYKKNINNYLQIIFQTKVNFHNVNFIITKKNNFLNSNQGFNNKKTIDNFDIYFNNEKDFKFINKFMNKYKNNLLKLNLTVQITNNFLYIFITKNHLYLLLNINNFKFYKNDLNKLVANVDDDFNNFKQILEIINKMVYDGYKSKH